MAIELIEYGSLASSTLLNRNFKDLEEQIRSLNLKISANISNIQNNTNDIANLSKRLSVLEND